MEEIKGESGEKDESLRLSKALSEKSLTLLIATVNREAQSYETDILNCFSFQDLEIVLTGSMADGAALFYGHGRIEESSDLDVIAVLKQLPVSESDISDNDWIVKIPDQQCMGYVRLKVKRCHPFLAHYECLDGEYISSRRLIDGIARSLEKQGSKVEVHGPAISEDLTPNVILEKIRKSRSIPKFRFDDPSFSTKSSHGVDKTDNVIGFESKTWPAEAEEWRTRKRQFDWPKRDLVEQIVETGCMFAPVGHKESPCKNLQWRISFNKAESMLIRSFNETQWQCYILLKILNTEILKRVSRGNITSYIMKVTLFWVSESMPHDAWQPETLIKRFLDCISLLRDWILSRNMPNYFIMKRNMFLGSELSYEVVQDTVTALKRIANDPTGELCHLELLSDCSRCSLDELEFQTLLTEVGNWLSCRVKMAEAYYLCGNQILHQACEYKNVPKSIHTCETVLEHLSRLGGYTKPMCDIVQNYLAVLHYANAMMQDNADFAWNEKEKAMKYFDASKNVDFTNAPLRMATCLLMEKRYKETLCLIKQAMAYNTKLACRPHYKERVNNLHYEALQGTFKSIEAEKRLEDLKQIHHIIKRDIKDRNLQQTINSLRSQYNDVANVLACAWTCICFDVIFTSAEISILPKPVRLEAMKKDNQEFVPTRDLSSVMVLDKTFILTLDPRIYACYLRFLCKFQMRSSKDICKRCLFCLTRAITEGPDKYRPIGFNLLSYCWMQLGFYRSAALCLTKSLQLKPDKDNVAYDHFRTIIRILIQIDFGSNMKDKNQDKELSEGTIIYQRTNHLT